MVWDVLPNSDWFDSANDCHHNNVHDYNNIDHHDDYYGAAAGRVVVLLG